MKDLQEKLKKKQAIIDEQIVVLDEYRNTINFLELKLKRVCKVKEFRQNSKIVKDKFYLYEMFNATSTDDGKGNIETYENWLERQLLMRIKVIEETNINNETK